MVRKTEQLKVMKNSTQKNNSILTRYSDDYRLCAFGVVSEYLLPELADALQVYKLLQLEDTYVELPIFIIII